MGFFDLNIPYLELEPPTRSPENTTKNIRLKTVVQALELGYTGIAYNRSIKGVISDKDICTIPQFPLSSLLKLSPNLSSSANFHRQLLHVPVDSPFRQYTRLTVAVDSLIQCKALNSSNSVLKTYDIVAVRPVNQVAFEYTCESAVVDLIAIDFTDSLPFQFKCSSVEAALKRGIYFEITYSPLISDVNARKQTVLATKLLVQWTRGKNLIISSAATSVSEIRGPCDVANLSFVLGVSMECARAAISKNCRSLLLNAVKKKQYCKNTPDVKTISSEKSESKEAWFYDGNSRDCVSGSERDLLLDDIAKSFAASSKIHKTSKSINSGLIFNEAPASGIHVEDQLPKSGAKVHFPLNPDSHQVIRPSYKPGVDSIAGETLLVSTPKSQASSGQDIPKSVPGNDIPVILTDEIGRVLECALPTPTTKDHQASDCLGEARGSPELNIPTIENNVMDAMNITQLSTLFKEMSPTSCDGDDITVQAPDLRKIKVIPESERKNVNLMLDGCHLSIKKDDTNCEKQGHSKDHEIKRPDSVSVQPNKRRRLKSGKSRSMQRKSRRASPYHLKRLSHSLIFGKKFCKYKNT